MDNNRIDSYLRCISSVLNFDIGEVWVIKKNQNDKISLTFEHLYTSSKYVDKHNVLLRPDENGNNDLDLNHRFSPIICRSVCDNSNGQIVWCNTCNIEKVLIGKTDLRLNTALGIPVCNIGHELCIFVLFSTKHLHITPNIVEFLIDIVRACAGNYSLSSSNNILPICKSYNLAPINTNQFIGLWDLDELMGKYNHNNVKFHMYSFNEFGKDSFLDNMVENFKYNREQQIKITTNKNSSIPLVGKRKSRSDSLDDWKKCKLINEEHFAEFQLLWNDIDDTVSSRTSNSSSTLSSIGNNSEEEDDDSIIPNQRSKNSNHSPLQSVLVNSFTAYVTHQNRFHEFAKSILGISSFDSAELWFQTDEDDTLSVVSAVHNVKDNTMNCWLQSCELLKLNYGQDTAGVVMVTNQPYWDINYAKQNNHKNIDEVNDDYTYPRAKLAAEIGIETSFGIPMIGPKGCNGAMVFYSRSQVEPDIFINTLTTQGVLFLSTASLNQELVEGFDNESLAHIPGVILFNWMERAAVVHHNNNNNNNNNTSSNSSNSTRSNANKTIAEDKSNNNYSNSNNSNKCEVESCTGRVAKKSPYCTLHSGGRRCHHEGCTKCSQGSTKFCIAHGGGRRCTIRGCSKGARDKLYCAAHGGGKRCGIDGCNTSAVGGSKLCTSHGGGKRCQMEGCNKASQSSTPYCVRHGGGRKCIEYGCRKVARGRTDYCAAHAYNITVSATSISQSIIN